MSAASTIGLLKEQAATAWRARTDQERRFLAVGAAVVGLALLYTLLVAPALDGRARLEKDLPELRQQAAQLQAMAAEASTLAHQPPVQLVPMTRESLAASLATRGITPLALTMTGEYAKLQLKEVAFANLISWLDAQRHESRIQVQEANIVAVNDVGLVDATLTLRQNSSESVPGQR